LVDRREDLDAVWRLLGEPTIVPGWATVELDRAEVERGRVSADRGPAPRIEDAPDDELLGARCRLVTADTAPSEVLLEPNTEGRLAGSLARFGEGLAAAYLLGEADAVDRARASGIVLSAEGGGPFGRQRLVVAGPRWGPHVVLAFGPRATIDR
jgi:hypothetical protein